MLRDARMAAKRKLRRGVETTDERRLWAGHVDPALAFARGGQRKFAPFPSGLGDSAFRSPTVVILSPQPIPIRPVLRPYAVQQEEPRKALYHWARDRNLVSFKLEAELSVTDHHFDTAIMQLPVMIGTDRHDVGRMQRTLGEL